MSDSADAAIVAAHTEDDRAPVAAAGDDRTADAGGRQRGRTIGAAVIGVVAVLVLSVTIVAVWAKATVLRAEPVADLVGDALEEPEVQAALATYITETVANAVDLESVVTSILPSQLARFAPAIAGGAETVVERRLTEVLGTETVRNIVTTVVERAHNRAMRLLEGDGLVDGITVQNGEVTVNLLPLVGRGLEAVQSAGLLSDVQLPELTADGDPAQQIAELSAALGRDLNPDLGQLVVYRSESLESAQETVQNAQRILALAERAVWVLVVLSVVLIAATILVAARRWRAALVLGLGTAAAMVLLRTAVREVAADAPNLVRRPGAKAALGAILDGASATLLRLAGVVLIIALLVVALTLLRTRWRRQDLVLTVAVVVGTALVAVLGVRLWSIALGVAVGIAVAFVARRVLPPAAPPPTEPSTAPPSAAPPPAEPSASPLPA
jgi:hypothetical protein